MCSLGTKQEGCLLMYTSHTTTLQRYEVNLYTSDIKKNRSQKTSKSNRCEVEGNKANVLGANNIEL